MRGVKGYFFRGEDVRGAASNLPRGRPGTAAADLAGSTLLMKAVTVLARGSLEAGSVKTYTPGLHKFQMFVKDTCAKLATPSGHTRPIRRSEIRELVSTKGVVEAFVAYAHEKGLRDTTFDVYIAGLKYFRDGCFWEAANPGFANGQAIVEGLSEGARGASRGQIRYWDFAPQEIGQPFEPKRRRAIRGRAVESDVLLCFLCGFENFGVFADS